MPNPIIMKHWLSLRDAARLVGHDLCDSDWSDSVLDDAQHPLHRTIKKDLYSALESKEVEVVLLDRGVWPKPLTPELSLHTAFGINIPEDIVGLGVNHRPDPADTYTCQIKRSDLENFLSRYRSTRSAAAYTKKAETDSHRWLAGRMKNGAKKEKSKSEYFRQAQRDFGVSKKGFDRAWKAAIEETGANQWSQGGRPKKPLR